MTTPLDAVLEDLVLHFTRIHLINVVHCMLERLYYSNRGLLKQIWRYGVRQSSMGTVEDAARQNLSNEEFHCIPHYWMSGMKAPMDASHLED